MSTDIDKTEEFIKIMRSCKGRAVQMRPLNGLRDWIDVKVPRWNWQLNEYRPKPPEFPALPEGLEWYTAERDKGVISPEIVGEGFRLAVKGEDVLWDGECFLSSKKIWLKVNHCVISLGSGDTIRVPLSTPFPEPPEPKARVPLTESDLPGIVWIMAPNGGHVLITEFPEYGVIAGTFKASFRDLMDSGFKWSTDRKSWQPCSKEVAS